MRIFCMFRITLMALPALLAGCEASVIPPAVLVESATYYMEHREQAQSTAKKCIELDAEKQRTLGLWDYQYWRMSDEWVNCENAISVVNAFEMRDTVFALPDHGSGELPSSAPALPDASDQTAAIASAH